MPSLHEGAQDPDILPDPVGQNDRMRCQGPSASPALPETGPKAGRAADGSPGTPNEVWHSRVASAAVMAKVTFRMDRASGSCRSVGRLAHRRRMHGKGKGPPMRSLPEPPVRFELTTCSLRMSCSTAELRRLMRAANVDARSVQRLVKRSVPAPSTWSVYRPAGKEAISRRCCPLACADS